MAKKMLKCFAKRKGVSEKTLAWTAVKQHKEDKLKDLMKKGHPTAEEASSKKNKKDDKKSKGKEKKSSASKDDKKKTKKDEKTKTSDNKKTSSGSSSSNSKEVDELLEKLSDDYLTDKSKL